MRSPPLAFAAALALLALTGRIDADPAETPPAEALAMSADRVELDLEAKTALLTGHVELKRGAMTVRCPRVDVRYDQVPHVTWAKGTGGVVAEVKGVKAESPEVELDLAGQRLELRGGVRLRRGDGWLAADQATIHLATAKVSMTGVKGSIPIDDAGSAGQPRAPRAAP